MTTLLAASRNRPLGTWPTYHHRVEKPSHTLVDSRVRSEIKRFTVEIPALSQKLGTKPQVAAQRFENVLPRTCCFRATHRHDVAFGPGSHAVRYNSIIGPVATANDIACTRNCHPGFPVVKKSVTV